MSKLLRRPQRARRRRFVFQYLDDLSHFFLVRGYRRRFRDRTFRRDRLVFTVWRVAATATVHGPSTSAQRRFRSARVQRTIRLRNYDDTRSPFNNKR